MTAGISGPRLSAMLRKLADDIDDRRAVPQRAMFMEIDRAKDDPQFVLRLAYSVVKARKK